MHSFLNITVRARLVLPNTRCKVKGLGQHPEVPFDLSFDYFAYVSLYCKHDRYEYFTENIMTSVDRMQGPNGDSEQGTARI